jgi:hypothetical protein
MPSRLSSGALRNPAKGAVRFLGKMGDYSTLETLLHREAALLVVLQFYAGRLQ